MSTKTIVSFILLITSLTAQAGFQTGYVYTRGQVLSEAGNPIWVTYDANGKVVATLGEATGELDPKTWWVLSGERHRAFEEVYKELRNRYPTLEAPITKAAFYSTVFTTLDGTTINKPRLNDSTAYVSVLPQEYRLINNPDQLVLAQYSINPANPVAENIQSMLVNELGQTKLQMPNRIGFKVNILSDKDATNVFRDHGEKVHGPIPRKPGSDTSFLLYTFYFRNPHETRVRYQFSLI